MHYRASSAPETSFCEDYEVFCFLIIYRIYLAGMIDLSLIAEIVSILHDPSYMVIPGPFFWKIAELFFQTKKVLSRCVQVPDAAEHVPKVWGAAEQGADQAPAEVIIYIYIPGPFSKG